MDFKSFFLDYFQKCLNENKTISVQEMQAMATENKKAADLAFEELWNDGFITGKPNSNVFEPGLKLENFNTITLTSKGINYLQRRISTENIADYFSNINSALKAFQATLNKIPTKLENISSAKQLAELHNKLPNIPEAAFESQFTPEQIRQISDMYSDFAQQLEGIYGTKHKKIVQDYVDTVEQARNSLTEAVTQAPSNIVFEKPIKKSTKKEDGPQIYTFEGILGQNCGEVVASDSGDDKRTQAKGFKVKNGIKILRGFANSAMLASASQKDKNYQRTESLEHLHAIETFVKNIRTSAKYLPEVTLIARNYESLEKIKISGSLSEKQQGELENFENYKLTVTEGQLYRIDGNHRIEALKNDSYYIPFSIIIWKDSEINHDDEAFLFYFLNSKAKKLTTEENLKGLVRSNTWTDTELAEANKYLPHLKYLDKEIQSNQFISSYFCDHEPIKNIVEILDKINEEIELEKFKKILRVTNELLILDRWNGLKKFNFYCQLIFYVVYVNLSEKDESTNRICGSILDNINNWVRKYKFDNTTFDNPIMLYKSAERTNNTHPIRVFVAMPYYDDETIDEVNDQLKRLTEELIKKYPLLENRFEIYEVMKHRGYAIDIQKQIIEQIKNAKIFIADVSEHVCKKERKTVTSHANPNVMYELGLAKGQPDTEIILLKNKKDKLEVPSDIITKYYNKFEFDKKYTMRKKLFEAIENILKDKFEIL